MILDIRPPGFFMLGLLACVPLGALTCDYAVQRNTGNKGGDLLVLVHRLKGNGVIQISNLNSPVECLELCDNMPDCQTVLVDRRTNADDTEDYCLFKAISNASDDYFVTNMVIYRKQTCACFAEAPPNLERMCMSRGLKLNGASRTEDKRRSLGYSMQRAAQMGKVMEWDRRAAYCTDIGSGGKLSRSSVTPVVAAAGHGQSSPVNCKYGSATARPSMATCQNGIWLPNHIECRACMRNTILMDSCEDHTPGRCSSAPIHPAKTLHANISKTVNFNINNDVYHNYYIIVFYYHNNYCIISKFNVDHFNDYIFNHVYYNCTIDFHFNQHINNICDLVDFNSHNFNDYIVDIDNSISNIYHNRNFTNDFKTYQIYNYNLSNYFNFNDFNIYRIYKYVNYFNFKDLALIINYFFIKFLHNDVFVIKVHLNHYNISTINFNHCNYSFHISTHDINNYNY